MGDRRRGGGEGPQPRPGLAPNDFEAQALTVPVVQSEWVRQIGTVGETTGGPQLILGPGTGLGASALLEIDGKHFALASEAGHVDFGPVGAEEAAVWPHIPMTTHGRISAETVLSGPGLLRLHKARFSARGLIAPTYDDATLVERARADRHGEEAATVRLFWRLAARYAGDMTMVFLATGGVTFSGGVLPRIVDFLDPYRVPRPLRGQGTVRRTPAQSRDPDPAGQRRGPLRHGRHRRRSGQIRDRLRKPGVVRLTPRKTGRGAADAAENRTWCG
jgi:Glucokinase